MPGIISLFLAIFLWGASSPAAFAGDADDDSVDVAHLLFSHIGDSYGWHITDWNGKHVSVPLPCIVRGSGGWHVFMSSEIAMGTYMRAFSLQRKDLMKGRLWSLALTVKSCVRLTYP